MKLRQLYTFKVVCEEESITKAAEKLSTTQPAISRTISELEDTLGTQLFDRVSRKVYLNETGKLFLSKVIPFLELYDDLEHTFKNFENQATLKIGSSSTIADYILPSILKKFQSSNHDTMVKVSINNVAVLEKQLLHHEIDLVLAEGIMEDEQLVKVPFSSTPLVVLCSSQHRFAQTGYISVKDLLEEPLLLRETGSSIRHIIDSAFLFHNESAAPAWTSNNSYSLLRAAKNNLGITILPQIMAEDDLNRGDLIEIPIQDFNIACVNHIIFHKDKYQTLAFQSLVNSVLFLGN